MPLRSIALFLRPDLHPSAVVCQFLSLLSMATPSLQVHCIPGSTVGHNVTNRVHLDSSADIQFIDISSVFVCTVRVTSWHIYAKASGRLSLQVWRPVHANVYRLIAEESIVVDRPGVSELPVSEYKPTIVHRNDVIGWKQHGAAIVPFDDLGERVIWAQRNGVTSVGDSSHFTQSSQRTYSIAATVAGLSASFSGGQFISYSLHPNSTYSSSQFQFPKFISLTFRTRWAPAFLLSVHSGDHSLSSRLTENGLLVVQYNDGSGFVSIASSSVYLSDNKWHSMTVSLLSDWLLFDVDGEKSNVSIRAKGTRTVAGIVYVSIGSSGIVGGEQGRNRGFVGCLADIQLNGIDPLAAVYSQQLGFEGHGTMSFSCVNDDPGVVTFLTTRSQVVAPPLTHGNLSVSFEYRTRERNCVLVYSRLAGNAASESYLALLLDNGMLRLEIKINGVCEKQCIPYTSESNMNDGAWHRLHLVTSETGLMLLHTDTREYWIPDVELINKIHPVGSLLIGSNGVSGFSGMYTPHPGTLVFLGCVRNLMVNEVFVDIVGQASWDGGLAAGCWEEQRDLCESSPCENGGVCVRGWGRYECDCVSGYRGDNCEIQITSLASTVGPPADVDIIGRWSAWSEWSSTCSGTCHVVVDQWRHRDCVDGAYCPGQSKQVHMCSSCLDEYEHGYYFSGSTFVQYSYPPSGQPQTVLDHINIVFSTRSTDSLLLLASVSTNTEQSDYLSVSVNGIGRLDVRIGYGLNTPTILISEETVSDGYQHSVSITRYGTFISLDMNNSNTQSVGGQMPELILLHRARIDVGRSRDSRVSLLSSFIGCLTHLSVNGLNLLSSAVRNPSLHSVKSNLVMALVCGKDQLPLSVQTPTGTMSTNETTPLVPETMHYTSDFGSLTIAILTVGCSLLIGITVVYCAVRCFKKQRRGIYECEEGETRGHHKSRETGSKLDVVTPGHPVQNGSGVIDGFV